MKIIKNHKNLTTFETIIAGECFNEDQNDEIMIKIEGADDINAVSLEDGSVYYFYPTDKVYSINANVLLSFEE